MFSFDAVPPGVELRWRSESMEMPTQANPNDQRVNLRWHDLDSNLP